MIFSDLSLILFTLLCVAAFCFAILGLLKYLRRQSRPATPAWPRVHAAAWLLALLCVLCAAAGVLAKSTPFDGRVLVRANKGITVGRNWGTPNKGVKFGFVAFAAGATTRNFVTSGTLPSCVPIVTPKTSLNSAAKYFAACTTDTLTITVDANPGTTVTFGYHIDCP